MSGRRMLGDALHDGKVALAFLTRLPMRPDRPWQDADLAASVAMFPLVGALVGLLGGLAYAGALALGLPPLVAAVLAVAALVCTTGALHEDGLADLADSFGGASRARRLEIMRDPRVGSFGVIALVLSLLARVGALAALATPAEAIATLVAAGALSRALMPAAMLLPRARADGLAATAGRPHPARVAAAAAIALLIALVLMPTAVAARAILAAALAGGALALLAQRRLGGVTGDVLGALQQVAEIAFLLAVVAVGAAP